MSDRASFRRAVAEIDFGGGEPTRYQVGRRSIHHFWHLFASHTRGVFLAPQRRPESDRIAWTWREPVVNPPLEAAELKEIRRRLNEASRLLSDDGMAGGDSQIDRQVHASVRELIVQLSGHGDAVLAGFVGRTETGLMLHSWGAVAPAQPQHPDDRAGEVSGAVWIEGERAGRVSLVLESNSGALVARSQSNQAGEFQFQAVAPGDYRIRVADRSDFPAHGLAFAMAREAVTGLELRGGSRSDEIGAGSSWRETEGGPWYRRWTALTVFIPAILGVAYCVWHPGTKPSGTLVASTTQSGWQTASGKLAALDQSSPGDKTAAAAGEPGWSELSHQISAPKKLRASFKARGEPAVGSESAAREVSLPDTAAGARPPEDALANPRDLAGAPIDATPLAERGPNGTPPAKSDSSPSDREQESEPASVEQASNSNSDRAPSRAVSSSGQGRKRSTASAPAAAVSDRDAGDDGAPAGSAPMQILPQSPTGASAGTIRSSKPAGAGAGPGSTSSGNSGEAANAASPAIDAAGSFGATPNQAQGLSPQRGASKNKTTGNLAAAAGSSAAGDAALQPANATDPDPESRSTQNGPNSSVQAQRHPNPTAPSDGANREAGQPPAENNTAPVGKAVAKDGSSANSKPVTAKAVAAVTKNSPSAATGEDGENSASDATPSSAEASEKNPRSVASASHAKSGSAASSGDGSEPGTDPQDGASEGTKPTKPAPAFAGPAETALEALGQISAGPWRARLLRDVVLSTVPVPAGSKDTVETLRSEQTQNQATRLPAALRRPQLTSGLAFNVPRGSEESGGSLHWRDAAGAEIPGGLVQGTRAELDWPGMAAPPNQDYVLIRDDGREVVRVSTGPTGVPDIHVAAGTQASFWIGVTRSLTDKAALADGKLVPHFDWRLLSGETIPRGWSRDDQWKDGRGQRIDLPLDRQSARKVSYALALVDSISGWALAGEVTFK